MKAYAATLGFAIALSSLVAHQAFAADIVLGGDVDDKVKVEIKKSSSNPSAHKIQYSAKDGEVVFTPGGGAIDDPPTNGAAAVIFSATDCQCLTLAPAPAVTPGWTQSPSSGTPTKYKWKDKLTKSTAQVKAGKIKFKKKGGLTYGLDATPQGEVEVQITFGNSPDKFCTRVAAPSTTNDTATKYKANLAAGAFGPACSAVPDTCTCHPCHPSGYAFVTKWGSSAAGTGSSTDPVGVAVDGSGNVFVADTGNHRIQKFTNTGTFLTKWGSSGSGDGQFSRSPWPSPWMGAGTSSSPTPATTASRSSRTPGPSSPSGAAWAAGTGSST